MDQPQTPNDTMIPLTERKVVRRGMIAGIASLGAAALVKVGGAGKAEANATGTISGTSTEGFGILASPGTVSPITPTIGTTTHGVIGSNSAVAILPMSSGVAGARNGSGFAGVLGVNANDGLGVYGVSDNGTGVQGFSQTAVGLRGLSTGFVGLVGISDAYIGLYGYTAAPSTPAFYSENIAASNRIAGYFNGDVQVNGNFTVLPGFAKNAAVAMPDGTDAVVYCQESLEPYFEDFGRGRLAGGAAHVELDRDFASIVKRDDYMVFITAGGDSKGLYVSNQTGQGFDVRESQGGKSDLPFTYRIVARRKDIEGKRLARLDPAVKANLAAMRAKTAAKVAATPQGLRGANPGAGTPLIPVGPELGTPRGQER